MNDLDYNTSCEGDISDGEVVIKYNSRAGVNWNVKIPSKVSGRVSKMHNVKYKKVLCTIATNLLAQKNKDMKLVYLRDKVNIPKNYNKHQYTYHQIFKTISWMEIG